MRNTLKVNFKSITDYIIFSLVLIFVLQSAFKFFGFYSLYEIFGLSREGLFAGKVWTVVSYSFLHEGPLHLIFNILGIHFISRNVEQYLSTESYIVFSVLTVICGSILWLFFSSGVSYLIGSSAFVMGSLSFFCLKRPDTPITFLLFFVLPVTLKPKYLLIGVLGIELYGFLFSEINNISSIAHSAHLGGMIAGALMTTNFTNYIKFPTFTFKQNSKKSEKFHYSEYEPSYTINFNNSREIEIEVDKILDKINEKGFGSLTEKEKNTLEKAKSLFNGNPNK